jgi:hypothetical protein
MAHRAYNTTRKLASNLLAHLKTFLIRFFSMFLKSWMRKSIIQQTYYKSRQL